MKNAKTYLILFWSTLKISLMTIGGGYVIIPLFKKRFVDDLGWIDEDEMLDLVSLAQSAPGPVAINTSVLVGYRMAGVSGAAVTIFATILPPLVFISIISVFYDAFRQNKAISTVLRAMQAGSAAVIVGVVVSMSQKIIKKKNVVPIVIMTLSFLASAFFNVSAIIVILICCALAIVSALYLKAKGKGDAAP